VARWIAVVLLCIGSLVGILGGTHLVSRSPMGFLPIIMGVVYGLSAFALVGLNSVKEFLRLQREGA